MFPRRVVLLPSLARFKRLHFTSRASLIPSRTPPSARVTLATSCQSALLHKDTSEEAPEMLVSWPALLGFLLPHNYLPAPFG